MSLIDSEAEKLAKLRSESGESLNSSRPASNMAGLSRRFGSLNKASKKMEEFRNKTSKPQAPAAPASEQKSAAVEHSRGTISDSRSSDELRSKNVAITEQDSNVSNTEQLRSKDPSGGESRSNYVAEENKGGQKIETPITEQLRSSEKTEEYSRSKHVADLDYSFTEQIRSKDILDSSSPNSNELITEQSRSRNIQARQLSSNHVAGDGQDNHVANTEHLRSNIKEGEASRSKYVASETPVVVAAGPKDPPQLSSNHVAKESSIEETRSNDRLSSKHVADASFDENGKTEGQLHSNYVAAFEPAPIDSMKVELVQNLVTEQLRSQLLKELTESVAPKSFFDSSHGQVLEDSQESKAQLANELLATQPAPSSNQTPGNKEVIAPKEGSSQSSSLDESNASTPSKTLAEANSAHEVRPVPKKRVAQAKEARDADQNELSTNTEQTRGKYVENLSSKHVANTEQLRGDYSAVTEQTSSKPIAITEPSRGTYGAEYVAESDGLVRLESVTGHERMLLEFIYEKCKETASLRTPPISSKDITQALNLADKDPVKAYNHACNLIHRVTKKKNLVKRAGGRPGKGGFSIFEISFDLHRQLVRAEQLRGKHVAEYNSLAPINIPIIKNHINTNREETQSTPLPQPITVAEVFPNIDLSSVKGFGITKKHLYDIKKNKWDISEDMLQELINKFPAYLRMPDMKKMPETEYPRCFMAIVRSKVKTGDCVLDFIDSDEDKEFEAQLAQIAALKAQREKKKAQLIAAKFEEWKHSEESQELSKQAPKLIQQVPSQLDNWLKNYFIENIFDRPKS